MMGNPDDLGFVEADRAMCDFIVGLFPICRSITGDGVGQTLEIIQNHIPFEGEEIPTGTRVNDGA